MNKLHFLANEVRDQIKGRLKRPPTEKDQWDLEKLVGISDINLVTQPQTFINPKSEQNSFDKLVLLSWNIEYGKEFDNILNSIKYFDKNIAKITAIALQEVDKNSPISNYKDVCFELAEALGFSAVYNASTAFLHPNKKPQVNDNKPCVNGEAILTRIPIVSEVTTLKLPPQYDFYNHRVSKNTTQNNKWGNRTALTLDLGYQGKKIRVTSAHLEDKTYSHRRAKQAKHIINDNEKSGVKDCFVCGDFNTFWSHFEKTEEYFKQAGYIPMNANTPTLKMKLPFRLDNIYAKTNMQFIETGVNKYSEGSDHYMIWSVFKA